MHTRNEFGRFLNEHSLTNSAVEVGTHRGAFAKILLDSWRGSLLHCVDPWSIPPDYVDQAETLHSKDREKDFRSALACLEEHKDRVILHRCLSLEAVNRFTNNELDFVYLDGNHEPPHVTNDIHAWWPKVRPGGILAGHDFMCPNERAGGWGKFIQPVVLEFFSASIIYLIIEADNSPWSYYVIKE